MICLIASIVFGTSCSSDSASSQTVSNIESTDEVVTTSSDIEKPTEKKPDAKKSSETDALTGKPIKELDKPNERTRESEDRIEKEKLTSPLADLGCCKDNLGKAQACCCDKIVSVYNDLLRGDEKALVRIKTKDPFFEDCSTKVDFLKKIENLEDIFYGDDED